MFFLNPSRWYLHPVFIFSCSIFALATFLVLTVSWYMEITSALEVVILKFRIDPKMIFPSKTGMTILILSALIAVVLIGILLAFIYYQKTVNLFRLFNIRQGLVPEQETASARLMEAPADGPNEGKTLAPEFDRMLRGYYREMGWDETTGKPLTETLERLGITER